MADRSDNELIFLAQASDSAALTELLKRHAATVRSRLQPLLPAQWRAEVTDDDVMQQTFQDVVCGIKRFEPSGDGSFLAWMTKVARNNIQTAIKGLEAEKRGGGWKRITPVGSDESYCALYELAGATSMTPSRLAAKIEGAKAVKAALEQMPEHYRTILQEHFIEGEEIATIATKLGKSPGSCHMTKARALEVMAELLGTPGKYLSQLG